MAYLNVGTPLFEVFFHTAWPQSRLRLLLRTSSSFSLVTLLSTLIASNNVRISWQCYFDFSPSVSDTSLSSIFLNFFPAGKSSSSRSWMDIMKTQSCVISYMVSAIRDTSKMKIGRRSFWWEIHYCI